MADFGFASEGCDDLLFLRVGHDELQSMQALVDVQAELRRCLHLVKRQQAGVFGDHQHDDEEARQEEEVEDGQNWPFVYRNNEPSNKRTNALNQLRHAVAEAVVDLQEELLEIVGEF